MTGVSWRNGSAWMLSFVLAAAAVFTTAGCQPAGREGAGEPVSKQVEVAPSNEGRPQATYAPQIVPATLRSYPRTDLGHIRVLADTRGFTIYTDNGPLNSAVASCIGVCANVWRPVLLASAKVRPTVPGLPDQFRTLPRPGGVYPLAVNGQRAYTFLGDTTPGQTRGQNFTTGNGVGIVYTWKATSVPSTAPATIHLQP